ncbi:MAG: hypothetical protein RLZZ546_3326 [Bacteroidota bacterium]|jgi:hypothetical protein
MKDLKFYLIILTLCIGNSSLLFSQNDTDIEDESSYIDLNNDAYDTEGKINILSISFGALIPQSSFKRNIKENKFHINLEYLRQIKLYSPAFVGLEIGYSRLQGYSQVVDIENFGVIESWNSNTTSSVWFGQIKTRYYFPFKIYKFDVFGEANLGTRWFVASTTISPLNDIDDGTSNSTEYDKNDLVACYGANLGLHLPIYQNSTFLQMKIGYQAGLSSYYFALKENLSSSYEYTQDAFDLKKSTTDMIKFDLGVSFTF